MKSKKYGKVNVLVVEDNPDDSELTLHAVRRGNKNANIIHLWNGEEVLDYLQERFGALGRSPSDAYR